MTASDSLTRADAAALDAKDTLASLRDRFSIPEGLVYLDGNSLGALPKGVPERVSRTVEQEWGHDLIRSWNTAGWSDLPLRLGAKLAPIVGAHEDEVLVADSTSANLFKLVVAAARLRPDRRVLVTEEGNFPTDGYIVESVASLLGLQTRWVPPGRIEDGLADDVAVVVVTHVDYRTGRMHDMATVTDAVHRAGALMLWDLSHSAGAVQLDLAGCEVDLAVGCTYKYLNGGPGSPAFAYVARRLQDEIDQPLAGWWGHAQPFALERDYRPAPGIARLQAGTAPIVSLTALEASLQVWRDVDLAAVRAKSLGLTNLFIALVDDRLATYDFEVVTPRRRDERGSQVSLRHPDAYPIMQALIARGVIGDFRAPDLDRFGFAPLYIRYLDVWDAVDHLVEVMRTGEWKQPEFAVRAAVT